MDLFARYESDFLELTNSISERILRIPSLTGDEKREEIEEAESEIADAEATLQSMGLQAKNVALGERANAQATVRRHQEEIRDLKKQMRGAQIAFTNSRNREALFDGATELQVTSLDQRERYTRATDLSRENKQRLLESRATLEEAIDSAADIMVELDDQRTRMERMLDAVRGINGKIGVAGQIMGRMGRRIMTNKLIILLIIFLLLAVIGVVIYLRFFYSMDGSGADKNDNQGGGNNNGSSTAQFRVFSSHASDSASR